MSPANRRRATAQGNLWKSYLFAWVAIISSLILRWKLAINVLGSLLIGVLAEWFAMRAQLPQPLRLFLITGVLGGFTTFSAFSLEVGLLMERGQMAAAAGYALASVVGAVGAMFVGMALVRHFGT